MAKQSIVSISTQDDLCNWEFVDVESDEDGSIYDVQSVDLFESIHSLSSSDDDDKEDSIADDKIDVSECARVSDLGKNCVDLLSLQLNIHDYDSRYRQFANDEDEDDDDDDSDGEYDVDDELVPWEVKDRFVRQRIRKSGKISCGRTARLKKSALVFTRPGCVRGKHSLGLKVY